MEVDTPNVFQKHPPFDAINGASSPKGALGTLADLPRWMCWKAIKRGDKLTKVPRRANGEPATSTDPSTWDSFHPCAQAARRAPHLFDGIGVALGALDDGRHLIGVDLDGCRDPETGAIKPWAREVIADFASYAEISPSGTGAKIYATCDPAPALAGNKIIVAERPGEHHHEQIEVYTTGRYFAVTGRRIADTPDEIADATAPMARMAARLAEARDAKSRPGINGKAAPPSGNDLPRAFLDLLDHDAPLAAAWHGGVKLGRGGDTSASGLDWSLAQHLGPHLDDDDLAAVLRRFRHGQIGGGGLVGSAAERRLGQLLAVVAERRETKPEAPPPAPQWPAPLAEEAYHGIVGEIARRIEPETEADPAAVLLQVLVLAGNAIGRAIDTAPYYRVEATRHYTNENLLLVGQTAKARKGTSWNRAREPFRDVDDFWEANRIVSGLSSGEGLIWEVRDPLTRVETDKTGETAEVVADAGVEDKRLLVVQEEFASVLRNIARTGNILSAVVRDAWDRGDLRTLTKNSPARATGAHISIIGHITEDELRRDLTRTEAANGFGNRFLIACVRRSKRLPFGGDPVDWSDLAPRLQAMIHSARGLGEVRMDDGAREVWAAIYDDLSEGKPGLLGAIVARGEAHVVRLALLYAVLDGKRLITPVHLKAALAVWDYCEASAKYLFGATLGDPVADAIVRALKDAPAGMSRTDISHMFGRHQSAADINRALEALRAQGLAVSVREDTGGRPSERWRSAR